jgi:hypothetical protein
MKDSHRGDDPSTPDLLVSSREYLISDSCRWHYNVWTVAVTIKAKRPTAFLTGDVHMNVKSNTHRPARNFRCLDGGARQPSAPVSRDCDLVIEDFDSLTAAIAFPTTGTCVSDYAAYAKTAAVAA